MKSLTFLILLEEKLRVYNLFVANSMVEYFIYTKKVNSSSLLLQKIRIDSFLAKYWENALPLNQLASKLWLSITWLQ